MREARVCKALRAARQACAARAPFKWLVLPQPFTTPRSSSCCASCSASPKVRRSPCTGLCSSGSAPFPAALLFRCPSRAAMSPRPSDTSRREGPCRAGGCFPGEDQSRASLLNSRRSTRCSVAMRGAPAERRASGGGGVRPRRRAPRHLVAPLALPQHARAGPGVRHRVLRRVHRPGAAIGLTYRAYPISRHCMCNENPRWSALRISVSL